jgi:hypothetical protein
MNIYIKNIIDFFIPLFPLIAFYIGWITLHYIAAQFYINYCTPRSFWGFFVSPFLSVAPHCNALRWIIYESGSILYGMWMSIATWFMANVLTYKTN